MTVSLPPVTINQWWCDGCGRRSTGTMDKHESSLTGKRCQGTDLLMIYQLTPESLAAIKRRTSRSEGESE